MEKIKINNIFEIIIIIINVLLFMNGIPIISNYIMEMISLLVFIEICYVLNNGKNIKITNLNKSIFIFFLILIFISFGFLYSFNLSTQKTYFLRFVVFFAQMFFVFRDKFVYKIFDFVKVLGCFVALTIIYDNLFISKGYEPHGILEDYQRAGQCMCFLSIISSLSLLLGLKKEKKLDCLSLIFGFITLLFLNKRMFLFLPIFIGFVVYIIYFRFKLNPKIIGIFFSCVILFLGIYAIFPQIGATITRFVENIDDKTYTFRTVFWDYAKKLFYKNKIIGIGFGTFPNYLESLNISSLPGFAAHNIYYQLLAETGIIGTTLFILFFSYNLLRTFIYLHRHKNYKIIYFSLAFQLWFVIYGFTGNPLYLAEEIYIYLLGICLLYNPNTFGSSYEKK